MAIMVNLDVVMAKRKMSLGELAQKVDITILPKTEGNRKAPKASFQKEPLPAAAGTRDGGTRLLFGYYFIVFR